MDISEYTTEDFVNNPDFVEWVKNPGKPETAYWAHVIAMNPAKAYEAEQARKIVRGLNFMRYEMPAADFEEARAKILRSIKLARQVSLQPAVGKKSLYASLWLRAAAVALLTMATGLFFMLSSVDNQLVSEETSYGEKKELSLPDGSRIVLNANSALTYRADWSAQENREVWLTGEGYFKVKKKSDGDRKVKFKVHAGDVTVEVLGTSFNVKQRETEVEIALEEGKINLKDAEAQNQMELEPGELAKYTVAEKKFEKQKVKTALYTAWKQNKMIFQSARLEEIAEDIRHVFGVNVEFENEELLNREFTGSFPDDNLEIIIQSLSKAYNLSAEITKEHIMLKSNQ